MKKIKITALAIMIIFSSCLFACQSSTEGSQPLDYVISKTWESPKVNSVYFNAIGGKDVMPIVGYIGPTRDVTASNGQEVPSLITDEMYRDIAESGVNAIAGQVDDYKNYKEDTMLAMDLASKYNIGYFIKDKYLVDIDGAYVFNQSFEDRMSEYMDHKSFCGLYFRDEPEIMMMNNLSIAMEEFYNASGSRKIHPYFNLYPYLVWNSVSGYTKYLDAFMETKPKYIAYDMYPFVTVGGESTMNDTYYTNMSIIKKYSDEYKIPFWSFMQSCGSNTDSENMRTPNEAELQFQVNTTLAYGAKGIKWFPLFHPHYWATTTPKGNGGLFYYDGTRTQFFDIAKRANTQILAIDHILMNATNMGIIFEGSSPVPTSNFAGEKIQSKTFRELTKVEAGSAMIGCFDYKGKTVLYVVNNSINSEDSVKLTFDNKYKYDIYRDGEKSEKKGSELTFEFNAGEAALVALN